VQNLSRRARPPWQRSRRAGDGNEHGIKRLVGEAQPHHRVERRHPRSPRSQTRGPSSSKSPCGSWQHAAELMILAAERGGSIEAATIQIENALFLEARYVRPCRRHLRRGVQDGRRRRFLARRRACREAVLGRRGPARGHARSRPCSPSPVVPPPPGQSRGFEKIGDILLLFRGLGVRQRPMSRSCARLQGRSVSPARLQ
jgi:hypothetical protein